jgi:hypothetical protein
MPSNLRLGALQLSPPCCPIVDRLGKHDFRCYLRQTAHRSSTQGQNRAFQTVSPVITVPELLPRRLVSNAVFEAGRVLSRIVPQRCPVVAHVHLATPGSVVAERVQRRVVSVAHDELRARRLG